MTRNDDIFAVLTARDTTRCTLWSDAASGLRAVLVIDDTTLGPGVGGTRLRSYPSLAAAIDDAAELARAMTIKCALGGIDAGGAKIVVIEHPGLRRQAAFARLGQLVEELDGQLLTAGDFGTTATDLHVMGQYTSHVHRGEDALVASVARGLIGCLRACVQVAGRDAPHAGPALTGLRVAVQGCGAIGAAAIRMLAQAGAALLIADIDSARAEALAAETGATIASPRDILRADVDVVCPCALGGVLTPEVAREMRAWAVCGAANNILSDASTEAVLLERGILHVPDVVASAGAVVDGVGERLMGLADRSALIDGLGDTAHELLVASRKTGRPTSALARERAQMRIQNLSR